MLRRLCVVFAAALLLAPAISQAQFKQGDWELTLNGGAVHGPDLDGVSASIGGSLGYFLTKDLEVAFRQAVGYTDFNAGTTVTASSRGAVDWHFDLGPNFKPFVGGNIGYNYGGRGVSDTWEVAPEAGVKFFVNSTTFIYGMAEYQIFFRHSSDVSFKNGSFVYSLGLGVVLNNAAACMI